MGYFRVELYAVSFFMLHLEGCNLYGMGARDNVEIAGQSFDAVTVRHPHLGEMVQLLEKRHMGVNVGQIGPAVFTSFRRHYFTTVLMGQKLSSITHSENG